jgi:hypothetical protein
LWNTIISGNLSSTDLYFFSVDTWLDIGYRRQKARSQPFENLKLCPKRKHKRERRKETERDGKRRKETEREGKRGKERERD